LRVAVEPRLPAPPVVPGSPVLQHFAVHSSATRRTAPAPTPGQGLSSGYGQADRPGRPGRRRKPRSGTAGCRRCQSCGKHRLTRTDAASAGSTTSEWGSQRGRDALCTRGRHAPARRHRGYHRFSPEGWRCG
jgi:hypothetical protein